MSITIAGPRGYEFQYRLTVLASLLHLENAVSLFVEKKGTEDAEVRLQVGASVRTIDIQVKKSASAVDLKTLTEWLCHFEEYIATNNLLDRILTKDHYCLFVAAGRCVDATSHFVSKLGSMDAHAPLTIDQTWVDSLAHELINNSWTGTTTLQNDRHAFCAAQGTAIRGNMQVEKPLRRLIIWEQVTEDQIDMTVNHLLNKKFKIPQSVTETAYLQLLETVRDGRDGQTDILNDVKKIIATNTGEKPLLDSGYKLRSEEAALIGKLTSVGTLLLSGNTQSGKSELSRKLASSLYDQGFAYYITADVADVNHFFSMNMSEDKVCILEDPWGHLQALTGSADSWRKLGTIIGNKRANHKLIVTSRSEIVTEMAALTGSASINGLCWDDVTISDRTVLKDFWQKFIGEASLDSSVAAAITTHLESSTAGSLLQIGQLYYLSRIDNTEIAGKNTDELLHLARQGAAEIAGNLLGSHSDAAEILTLICMLGDTITPVSLQDLGYLLSADTNSYSIRKQRMWSSSMVDSPDPFPAYPTAFTIGGTEMQALEYLERRGFINLSKDQLMLSHPNYYEAGRFLFTAGGSIRQSRILKSFLKAIQCVNHQSAVHALKQLALLENEVTTDLIPDVYQLATNAFDSVFPAVEDIATVYLISRLTKLPEGTRKLLLSKLEDSDVPTSHIFWKDGVPYVSEQSKFLLSGVEEMAEAEVQDIENKLAQGHQVSSAKAWEFLGNVPAYPSIAITNEAFKALLQYPEVFIRKRVASLFFLKSLTSADTTMINLFFADEHPSVTYSSIRGSIVSWPTHPAPVKAHLSQLIKDALTRQPVAIRCNQFITTFSTDYKYDAIPWDKLSDPEKKELWNLWADIYPDFIRLLPPTVFLDTGRFGITMDEAFAILDLPAGIKVLSAWYDRIDFKIKAGIYLDEYELSLAQTLFDFTGTDHAIRKHLVGKMLQYPNTNFLLSTLKWAINYWDKLSDDEKSAILALVNSGRVDQRWIRAVLLFSYKSPAPEIQLAILGDTSAFDKTPEEFIKLIHPDLLQDCLKAYFGKQPFWWLAIQYRNPEFWQPIVFEILEKQIEPFFEYCLENLVSWGSQGFSSQWKPGEDLWDRLCASMADKSVLAKVFIEKLSVINTSPHYSSKMCKALYDGYIAAGNQDEFIKNLASNIEMLQQTGHKEDLIEIFGDKMLDQVLMQLNPDSLLINGVRYLSKKPGNTDSFDKILDMVLEAGLSVRFFFTVTFVTNVLNKLGLGVMFKDKLSLIPDRIEQVGDAAVEILKNKDYEELPDWIK